MLQEREVRSKSLWKFTGIQAFLSSLLLLRIHPVFNPWRLTEVGNHLTLSMKSKHRQIKIKLNSILINKLIVCVSKILALPI